MKPSSVVNRLPGSVSDVRLGGDLLCLAVNGVESVRASLW